MKFVTNIFFKGVAAVLPVALTLYLVYWLGTSLEKLLRPVITSILPENLYLPGAGLGAGLVLLFLCGLLVDAWVVRRLFHLGELLLEKIPLVKSVYGALRDFIDYFSRMQQDDELQKVVAVRIGDMRLIGFLTGDDDGKNLPVESSLNDLVSVYLPMSYQIGGFTVYVERGQVEHLDIPVEDAMRLVLTAGLSKSAGMENELRDT